MATTLRKINVVNVNSIVHSHLNLTVFFGGNKYGKCVQVSPSFGSFFELDMAGAEELRNQLNAVIDGDYHQLEEGVNGEG
jgi:hypothetical protein